jgi:DNA-binding transcriptional LysR family regulator
LEAAESALRTIRASKGAQTSLSVVPDYYSFPERRILVEQFVRSNPETNLSIYWGTVDQIIPRLINGQTDLVFASTNVPFGDMLEATPVCARRAVAMVPEEHPLARRGAMDLEELSGASVVVSPGYSHPDNVKVSLRSLLEAGAKLVPAPDSGAATIEHFARVHRFLCLRWLRTNPVERQVGDMVLVPISGAPLKTTNGLWRRRGSKSSPGALALWRSAALLHRVIEAGDRDPAYSKIKSDIERPLAELG